MTSDAPTQLQLLPEHLRTLAAFGGRRVMGVQLCKGGQFDPAAFASYGRLEVLANCGLVEFLTRDGQRHAGSGDVVIFYYMTDRGRDLLRWRVGGMEAGLNPPSPVPRYEPAGAAAPSPRS